MSTFWTPRVQIGLLVFLGLALFSGSYVWEINSDGFRFVEQQLRKSSALQSQIGPVEKVELPIYYNYHQKDSGADSWLKMSLRVRGVTRTAKVDVKAKRINGAWEIEEIMVDGRPIR